VTRRCTGRGHGMTRRVRSVQRKQSGARVLGFTTGASGHSRDRRVRSVAQRELRFTRTIGRAARPVTHDRTRPIVEGAYWTQTGCWHCRVRSLREARPVMSLRARYCAIGASGRCEGRVRSLRRGRAGQCDRRVRSFERRVRSFDGRVRSLPGARPIVGLTVGGSDVVERVRSVTIGASGHPEKDPVKG
jgi:hypothetical protein